MAAIGDVLLMRRRANLAHMSALANSLYEVCVFASATFWLSGCLAEEPTADYRTLPGEFAREVLTEPLVATEAFIDDEQFYVRYEGPGGTLYSGGEWTQRIGMVSPR
jgi:hypothetical protein